MSMECGECERDLRGGHDESCSRHPKNRKMRRLERLKESPSVEMVQVPDHIVTLDTRPFCRACNAVGMSHCAHPEECGGPVIRYDVHLSILAAERKRLTGTDNAMEVVGYEYRWYDSHPNTVTSGKWSSWERCTETTFNEILEYIADGKQYEVRRLYAESVKNLAFDLLKELREHSWEWWADNPELWRDWCRRANHLVGKDGSANIAVVNIAKANEDDDDENGEYDLDDEEEQYTECPKCKQHTVKAKWSGVECTNPDCGYSYCV